MSGIFLVIAIASAFCWFAWRRYRQGYTLDDSTEVLVIALIGGILGGRIFYVLQNFREYMKYLPYIFRVTDGGYGMIGSVLGVCAISFFPLKKKKMSVCHSHGSRRILDCLFLARHSKRRQGVVYLVVDWV